MSKSSFVSYTGKEKDIVRQGISAIREVLKGTDISAKRSLLLCLDWFMDPYYQQDISYMRDKLIVLLQEVVISDDPVEVKKDALDLLGDYEWGPFELLEKCYEKIDMEIRPDADYVINMHRVAMIEPVVLDKCKEIYEDYRKVFQGVSDKVWIIYNTSLTEKMGPIDVDMSWLMEDGKIRNAPEYKMKKRMAADEQGFFLEPVMQFNLNIKERYVLLVRQFALGTACCFRYDLLYDGEKYSLGNERIVWHE